MVLNKLLYLFRTCILIAMLIFKVTHIDDGSQRISLHSIKNTEYISVSWADCQSVRLTMEMTAITLRMFVLLRVVWTRFVLDHNDLEHMWKCYTTTVFALYACVVYSPRCRRSPLWSWHSEISRQRRWGACWPRPGVLPDDTRSNRCRGHTNTVNT